MIKSKYYIEELKQFVEDFDFSPFKNSTFLVTGATGLIGSYLVDSLLASNKNIKVIVIARNLEKAKKMFESKLVKFVQLTDYNFDYISIKNIDYIVSAAGYSDPKNFANYPVETIKVNANLNLTLLELSKQLKNLKKYIYLSSGEIYGKCENILYENTLGLVDTTDIRSCYNESKRLTETMCVSYFDEYGVPATIARLSRIYGPTMKIEDSKALSQFIKNSLKGEDIVLKSKGEQLFSYCYVKDAVSGILTLLLKGNCGEAYNLTSDESLKLKDIAGQVASLCGRKVVFELPSELEQKGFSRSVVSVLDTTKIKNLGWKATVSFKDGLEETIKILKEIY
jgi:nucleoside-diphosphate-sugar epimerase